MKLISSKSKGRHVAKSNGYAEPKQRRKAENVAANTASIKPRKKKASTKKKVIIVIASILGLVLVLGASTAAVVRWEIQPFYDYFFKPDMSVLAVQPAPNNPIRPQEPESTETPTAPDIENEDSIAGEYYEEEEEEEVVPERKEEVYTFLMLGIDLDGNTDVVMVATFDAKESTLDVVSLPRDTIVNVPWSLRKVNSIHAHARNMYRGQNVASDEIVEETFKHFRNLLGYNLDFMITISMGAFPRIVDAIGPISFNVPRNINVDGVHIPAGNQRLNGRQALLVMRDRNSHPNGDIGRATTQQEFLNTIMRQFLANRNSIKVDDMANIFLRHTNTNIQLNHLVWLGREFLKMDASNINFHMMPGEFEALRGNFYISIQLEPWLKLINEKLSPLNREITEEDVSILTRGPDRRLYVTDGNWLGSNTWGGSGTGSSNPQTTTGP